MKSSRRPSIAAVPYELACREAWSATAKCRLVGGTAMIVSVLLGLLGLAMLTVAADQLVLGASHVAARFGISPIVVGVVVIGLGTSTPEFLVVGLAAAHGETGLAVGS